MGDVAQAEKSGRAPGITISCPSLSHAHLPAPQIYACQAACPNTNRFYCIHAVKPCCQALLSGLAVNLLFCWLIYKSSRTSQENILAQAKPTQVEVLACHNQLIKWAEITAGSNPVLFSPKHQSKLLTSSTKATAKSVLLLFAQDQMTE